MKSKNIIVLCYLVLLAGLVLLQLGAINYSLSYFIYFPILIGVVVGFYIRDYKNTFPSAILGVLLGYLIFALSAILSGSEGWVCMLMAFPITIVEIILGVIIGKKISIDLMKKNGDNEPKNYIIIFPLIFLLVADKIESKITEKSNFVSVTTSATLPFNARDVFNSIKSMDTLDAEKPWLLRIGLPTPYKCILEENKVGAKRTCLFENGKIVAEITDYKPDTLLKMKVIEYTLTGRHWFNFQDAYYTFEQLGDSTKITRISTYSSVLKPRLYWEPLEVYSINQEHEFVLESLRKNLQKKHPF